MSNFVKRRDFVTSFHNPDLHGFPTPESFLEQCKNVENLRYLCFQWEKTPSSFDENGNLIETKDEDGVKSISHYQMYLEFTKNTSYKTIQRELFKGRKLHFKQRFGTQEEAINYCANKGDYSDPKEAKELFRDGFFEYGTPKKSYSLVNNDDIEIPSNEKEQWIHIRDRIISGYYKKLDDVEKDYPYLVIKHENLVQRLVNKYNPISRLNVVPCRVVWIFGDKGTGKSSFTKKYLRSLGYSDAEVGKISPQNMTYNDKVYFDLDDERCKALVISEVDMKFPRHNNLIAFIDRDVRLTTKGSHIRNNFELIIINSIYRPEEIFSYLGRKEAGQILRRIFPNPFGSKVIQILPNEAQLFMVYNKLKKFDSDIEFQDWYEPISLEIPEEDLFLIPLP